MSCSMPSLLSDSDHARLRVPDGVALSFPPLWRSASTAACCPILPSGAATGTHPHLSSSLSAQNKALGQGFVWQDWMWEVISSHAPPYAASFIHRWYACAASGTQRYPRQHARGCRRFRSLRQRQRQSRAAVRGSRGRPGCRHPGRMVLPLAPPHGLPASCRFAGAGRSAPQASEAAPGSG